MSKEKNIFHVSEDTALLEFLLKSFPSKSRNNVKNLMKCGFCSVEGKIVTKFDHPLRAGQTLVVSQKNAIRSSLPFEIIYEDSKIIVIDKPAGLLCISNDHEKERTAYRLLSEYVKSEDSKNKIFIIHRLDRDTSGIVMFAKDEDTKIKYQDNWDKLVRVRGYAAVCEGKLPEESATLSSYLTESRDHRVFTTDNPNRGKKAITRYTVKKTNGKYSLLDVEIDTGRKNQIRVQLAEIGCPVVGDKKYGAKSNPISRLGLHASFLEIISPEGKRFLFKSRVPSIFRSVCK